MSKSEADRNHISELLTQLESAADRLESMDARVKAAEKEALEAREREERTEQEATKTLSA